MTAIEEFRQISIPLRGATSGHTRPGYSKDGRSAVILFEGGPNGIHGLNWVYMLAKKGKRWEVQWRHCRPRE